MGGVDDSTALAHPSGSRLQQERATAWRECWNRSRVTQRLGSGGSQGRPSLQGDSEEVSTGPQIL